ncbi:MAG TPA: hypothetical protein VHD61_03175 [Lacunisphaera sp.]|nr:hypothetical protein [Lacunisphaera sp.]
MTGADIVTQLKKHPLSVVCGVLSIGCAVMLYLRADKIEEYQQLSDQKATEASNTLANVRNSEKLTEQTAEMQAAAKELEGRVVKAGQLAVNLQYFYRLEADTGVKLLDVRQGGLKRGAKPDSYVGVPYSVSIQGTFPQALNFLARLEKGSHFCKFLGATMSKSGDDVVSLSLSLEVLGVP